MLGLPRPQHCRCIYALPRLRSKGYLQRKTVGCLFQHNGGLFRWSPLGNFHHTKKGLKLHTTYFDSFALSPEIYKIKYPYDIDKQSNFVTQSQSSSMCGFLCIYFVYSRFSRQPIPQLGKDTERNEKLALTLVRKIRNRIQGRGKFICKFFGCYPSGAELTTTGRISGKSGK